MEDTDRRIAALENELAALKARMATAPEPESSRREMFKKLALAGAGVAAGGVLAQASPAAATDGVALVIGDEAQTAQTPTTLVANGFAGGQVLLVDDVSGFAAGSSIHPGALAGWSGARTGVYGFTQNGPYGVVAFGSSNNSTGLLAFGRKANAELSPSGLPAPQRAVAHNLGELVEDDNGDLWLCVVAGNPGTWRKLGGPATSGQLHLLAAPVRVYDSRPAAPPLAVLPKTQLVSNTPRTIDATGNTSGVPTAATGVLINITVTLGTAQGFLTAWPSGAFPGTSSINFSAGQTIAATTVTRCGPNATFLVLANVATDVIIDVIGYYQ
ncbi:MAG: hypothetical protein ACXVLX_15350 [Ilumatobacteraceae bacterium]